MPTVLPAGAPWGTWAAHRSQTGGKVQGFHSASFRRAGAGSIKKRERNPAPVFFLLLAVCRDDGVELFHQLFHRLVMDQAGLLHGLIPGGGAAQAVHADVDEGRGSLRGNVQDVAPRWYLW